MTGDQSTYRLIEQLLRDAALVQVHWDSALRTFAVTYDCLRRGIDGSKLVDRSVVLTLSDVKAVGVGYDCQTETRPSAFDPPQRLSEQELRHWPFQPREAALLINSTWLDDALDSAQLDWLQGDETALRKSAVRFCLMLDNWGQFGPPTFDLRLLVGADSFTISSGGGPLALDRWEAEMRSWSDGWQEYWSVKEEQEEFETEAKASDFDAAIPAGESPLPDLSYRPPPEPPFELEPTDAPAELLATLRDWYEARYQRDWPRLARIDPAHDETMVQRAEALARWNESADNFGRWGFARALDDWWIEGRRACAVVRGIEHEMPQEGDPAENRESVWTFALRWRECRWIIDSYVQGWPRFGSAKKLPSRRKPWLKRWQSGLVR